MQLPVPRLQTEKSTVNFSPPPHRNCHFCLLHGPRPYLRPYSWPPRRLGPCKILLNTYANDLHPSLGLSLIQLYIFVRTQDGESHVCIV
jgi:hypothetical protein